MARNSHAPKYIPDWNPRPLPGGFYCSPACGGAKGWCKRADYARAIKDSDALATRMGAGWETEVWENLGWHWRLRKGNFELHPDRDGTYSAWFKVDGTTINNITHAIQVIAEAKTPEDAVGFATQDVRTLVRRIEDALSDSGQSL